MTKPLRRQRTAVWRCSVALSAAMVACGLWLGWPLIWAGLAFEQSAGNILGVFTTDLDDGLVRISVSYEFAAGQTEDGLTRIALAWDRCDQLGRILPDFEFPPERAEAMVERLSLLQDSRHQTFSALLQPRVLYQRHDPPGSARIQLSEDGRATSLRRELLGLLLVATPALAWLLTAIAQLVCDLGRTICTTIRSRKEG